MIRSAAPKSASVEAITDGRRRRGAKSRAAVLSRAIDLASVEGLEGLTIGRLATDVGIAKGNITVLFGDKEALQLATLDASVDVFVDRVINRAIAHRKPIKRLQALCDNWFDYVDRRVLPGGCMLYGASNEYRARPGPIQDRVNHHRRAWARLLAATARDAQAAGQIASGADIDQLVFELMAFQAASNTAGLLGDEALFQRGRSACRALITAAQVTTTPPAGKTALQRRMGQVEKRRMRRRSLTLSGTERRN